MGNYNPPASLEQTTVYQLASTWLDDPTADREVLEWLVPLTHPDAGQRRIAVYQLWRQRDPRARIPLLVALSDPDEAVRAEAAHGLLYFRDTRNVEPLIVALLQGGRSVRSSAALGLGLIQDRRAVKPLLAVFREETDRRRQASEGGPYCLDGDLGAHAGQHTSLPRAHS